MRAKTKIYHIECFRCSACARQLIPGKISKTNLLKIGFPNQRKNSHNSVGDEFALRDGGALYCKEDHDHLEKSSQTSLIQSVEPNNNISSNTNQNSSSNNNNNTSISNNNNSSELGSMSGKYDLVIQLSAARGGASTSYSSFAKQRLPLDIRFSLFKTTTGRRAAISVVRLSNAV